MQETGFNYKKIRSELFLQYQVELDETSSSILYILQQEQKRFFAAQIQQLQEATRKINASNSSLQVDLKNPRSQAFWFGMGKWGLGLIMAVCIYTFYYGYHLDAEAQNRKTDGLVKWYAAYYQVSQKESKQKVMDFLKKFPMPEQ
jgi:hypothetical protein